MAVGWRFLDQRERDTRLYARIQNAVMKIESASENQRQCHDDHYHSAPLPSASEIDFFGMYNFTRTALTMATKEEIAAAPVIPSTKAC